MKPRESAGRRISSRPGRIKPFPVPTSTLVMGVLSILVSGQAALIGQAGLFESPQQASSDCTATGTCGTQTTQPSATNSGGQSILGGLPDGSASASAVQQGLRNPNLYIDSAGLLRTRSSEDLTLQRGVFSPDPPTDLQRLAQATTGEMLPIFGRDMFQNVPSTFAPGDQLPVTPDYVIGPGDEVLVRLWGPQTYNNQLTVDRSGSIYIPQVGAVHVAGLRFDELQQQIHTAIGRVYRNFNLTVNLGRLRSIQVYVVGEARRPGAYTISSLSTLLNALFASGGPGPRGSMRHIQLRRAGVTLPDFDLYDLVLRGDKSRDVRLESGDVIFIPSVGPQVALAGSVRHPAIYELTSGTTLQDLLDLAGGLSATAATDRITLDRIAPDKTRSGMSVALDAAGRVMKLDDGDVIYAGHITLGYEKTVTIRGNLANPGKFAWHDGMKLSEVIPDRMSLLTPDYWRQRNRLSVPSPLFTPTPRRSSYAQAAGQMPQTPNGVIAGQTLSALGQTNAGDSSYQTDSTTQWDYSQDQTNQVNQAVQTDQSQQAVLDSNGRVVSTQRFPQEVGPAVGGVVSQNPDASNPNRQQVQGGAESASKLFGGVLPPNRIQIPVPEINWSYAVIERLDPQTLKSTLVPFNLGRLVQDHDGTQDLPLQPGDVVTILSQSDVPVPLANQTKYIRLEGEFMSPGVYSAEPNETLDSLVRRAGGFTPKAYLYGSSFLRESARVFQQARLDEYITQLSADMDRSLAVRSVSSNTGVLDPNSLTEQRNLISNLRALRATGRVVLNFTPQSNAISAIPAIPLENGDVFRIPSVPSTVSVIGAVYGPNVFLYNGGYRIEDYLRLAGKPNRVADKNRAFIIRADGSVFSREGAQGPFSNRFISTIINPGDSIVIPEKLIRPTALKQLTDFSQILSSFGLAAAAINVVR